MIYENEVVKTLLTEVGYVSLRDGKYHYYLKDHQGNNRIVFDEDGKVEERNDYYPFGGLMASSIGTAQPYKYNGKELDRKNGLNWYDYGARLYDPLLGRFTCNDPLAEAWAHVIHILIVLIILSIVQTLPGWRPHTTGTKKDMRTKMGMKFHGKVCSESME